MRSISAIIAVVFVFLLGVMVYLVVQNRNSEALRLCIVALKGLVA